MPGENAMELEQNSTPDEGVSLHDALREAFEAAERKPEAAEVEEEAEEVEETEEAEEIDESEPEAEEEAEAEEESPALRAPDHWSAQDKETFNTLSQLGDAGRKAQQFLERRHKEMERAANEKFQEAAAIRKRGEALDEVLGSVKSEWAMRGIDEIAGIRSVLATYQELGRNPVGTLRTLAQQLNVDLSALAPQSDDPFADPETKRLKSELEQLKAQIAQQQAQQVQSAQSQYIQSIKEFEAETDEAGNLKHPHFQTVYDDMVRLVQAGIAADVKSAYQKAVALRPDLNAVQAKQPQAVDLEKAKADRIAKAKKAQKAAAGLRSGASSNALAGKPKSLRDELAALYDQHTY